jgi:hypothetical protein
MISLLKHLNYTQPTLKCGNFGSVEIRENEPGYYYLYINGEQWMAYNTKTHLEAYELYSHYILAEGHVIATGMGFGARENWILSKPNVTKLTIIELSEDLIGYHKQLGSSFLKDPRVEVINCDASEYKGSCDVLLLDHYEMLDSESTLANVKLVQDNIECNTMWFWPFERIIMDLRKMHTFNNEPRTLITKYDAYKILKDNWKLDKLHDFSEDEINLMCMMFHSKMFSQSESLLNTQFSNIEVYRELYGCI